jgi:hypothetical protein
MQVQKFDPNNKELINTIQETLETACAQLDFDLKCLDWFSYTPDFFIEKKNIKAA